VLDLSGKKRPASALINELALVVGEVDIVAIELPYLGKNVNTLRVLARLFGRFEQAFEPTGAEIVEVTAQHWQHRILGRFGGVRRESLKPAAIMWARATFGVQLTEDEADAAGVSACVLRERAYARKIRSASRV
jgi:Holliday junction resolvasome RuvABC endonuclease subunit